MNKKEVIKIFDLASFIAVIIATVLVVVFEIDGKALEINLALVMYDATALMLSVMFSLRLAFSVKSQDTDDELFKLSRKQMGGLITKLVLSILLFLLILIVLIIF